MKRWAIFVLSIMTAASAQINPKFTNPNHCKGCHEEKVKDWDSTWHSRSHEEKNPLYKAVLTYVQKTTHQTHADVAIGCAKCHNPRLGIRKVDPSYMYAKAFGLESDTTRKVEGALNANHVQSGISCYVCHNIDKIHPKNSPKDAGFDIISWTKGDEIVGPYPPNNRAGYHTTNDRSFFKEKNTLCLTCHEGSGNLHNVPGYETGTELLLSGQDTRCVECHMSSVKKSIIAPQIVRKGETPIARDLRSHLFAGARNSDILESTLSIYAHHTPSSVEIGIQNLTPHRVPTGFSGRSLIMQVRFLDSSGRQIGQPIHTDFRAIYRDGRGNEALSYIATKLEKDSRLKPLETRLVNLDRPLNSQKMEIKISYYLLSPQLQQIIPIEDEIFTKPYHVHSTVVQF
jgi:hypothetical protein